LLHQDFGVAALPPGGTVKYGQAHGAPPEWVDLSVG
jgi:hypothetical protein